MDVTVKVAVRCRPLSSKELARGCHSIVEAHDQRLHIQYPDKTGKDKDHDREFWFDFCFMEDSLQESVYSALGRPVLRQAFEGFNGTIFAYGQTGSGKSHSMMGSAIGSEGTGSDGLTIDRGLGIIPRLNADLWKHIEDFSVENTDKSHDESAATIQYLVTASFLEIYNEDVKDLLYRSDKSLKIRESPDRGIFVEGLCELVVKNAADVLRLIEQGNAVRRVAATNMNDQSSRKTISHISNGVTRVHLNKAKLNLVDLAGSERANKTGATGTTLKEGIGINASLTALGNVINALAGQAGGLAAGGKNGMKKPHVPYRDSKLTRLLQESLGGNAATVMIAAISPADYNYEETLSTLKYASRAKNISNTVTKNEDLTERVIKDLQGQIQELKELLARGSSGSNEEAEKQLLALQSLRQSDWEEKQRLSQLLEEERQRNMTAVAADMMTKIKEQKRLSIQRINALTSEKTTLSKRFKDSKEDNAKLTIAINEKTKSYQVLQKRYDSISSSLQRGKETGQSSAAMEDLERQAEEVTDQMTSLIEAVEKERSVWQDQRNELEQMRQRLSTISEEITDEKAELVACAGLLDQNDRIRSQIQEEERDKAREVIAAELAAAKEKLQQEKEDLRGNIEEEVAKQMEQLRQSLDIAQEELKLEKQATNALSDELKEQWQYSRDLEYQLQQTQDLVLQQELQMRAADTEHAMMIEDILRKHRDEIAELKRTHEDTIQEEKYLVFEGLMDSFQEERAEMTREINELRSLLKQATGDVLYLKERNDDLQSMLKQSLQWEPRTLDNKL